MDKRKEEDLAKEILQFLEKDGWDCYPEALLKYGRGRADIAAVKDDKFRIIEVKMSLSLALLNQANEWILTEGVDEVYIAVPSNKESRLVNEILRWKGIGKYTSLGERYSGTKYNISVTPGKTLTVNEKRKTAMMSSLHEDMKNYKPGTKSGFSTPYNRTITLIEDFIREKGSATMKEILELEHHYKSKLSARSSLSHAIEMFERDKFIVDKSQKEFIYTLRENNAL